MNTWLVGNLSFLPFFNEPSQVANMSTGGTMLTGGIVLAVMILPIITAVTREVFVQTPVGHREAALALGATKWEVVRVAILPFGFSGYISGSMLGLGRALGETMALLLIISTAGPLDFNLMESGETFATKIANNAAEFDSPLKTGAYISAGLALFVLTFVVNAAARSVVTRRPSDDRNHHRAPRTRSRQADACRLHPGHAAAQGDRQPRARPRQRRAPHRARAAGVADRDARRPGIEPIMSASWWQFDELHGGAFNAIIGTLQQTLLAAIISIPVGIFVAIYLVEYATGKSVLARVTTFMVDILSAFRPSSPPCSSTPSGARPWVCRDRASSSRSPWCC